MESLSLLHSDHIDGPATTEHSITDITDLYVFPHPQKAGVISMILNVHPLSREHNHFSDKVNYIFYIRKAKISGSAAATKVTTEETSEKQIVCSFKTPHDHTAHSMTCSLPGIGKESVIFKDSSIEAAPSGVKLYHGLKADPFFFYAKFAKSLAQKGTMIEPKNESTLAKTNVLTIAMEFSPAQMFGDDIPLLAVAAQSHTTNEKGDFKPLDRIGRPEVSNVTMVARKGFENLRDSYNFETPFRTDPKRAALYRQRIVENVTHYDAVDGKSDWSMPLKEAYAALIVEDFLLIDVSKSASGAQYFGIEAPILAGKPHSSFGGRGLSDDVMDILFGVLISRDGPPIADGVAGPDKAFSATFPYLAEPDDSFAGGAKAKIARTVLGSSDDVPNE